MKSSIHSALFVALSFLISGCGPGETAATATIKAEEARQANETVKAVKNQLDQINQKTKKRLEAAD